MDPRDPLVKRLAGVRCTACDGALPSDGIRILAQRDDVAFVDLRCGLCRTRTIGLLTPAGDDLANLKLDLARYGEFDAADELRLSGGRPIGGLDVEAVRSFLAGWTGDLASLVDSDGSHRAGPTW